MKSILLISVLILLAFVAKSQEKTDSTAVIAVLEELFTVCNSVQADGEGMGAIIFDRAAPYIVYRGEDISRQWTEACDYNKSRDREIVNKTGLKIKNWLDAVDKYKVVQYTTDKESEGNWHALVVSYQVGESDRRMVFAFLKVGNKFFLGDID